MYVTKSVMWQVACTPHKINEITTKKKSKHNDPQTHFLYTLYTYLLTQSYLNI